MNVKAGMVQRQIDDSLCNMIAAAIVSGEAIAAVVLCFSFFTFGHGDGKFAGWLRNTFLIGMKKVLEGFVKKRASNALTGHYQRAVISSLTTLRLTAHEITARVS